MCTLHEFVKIFDKMVYLFILFASNKTPQDQSKESIEVIECVLSKWVCMVDMSKLKKILRA